MSQLEAYAETPEEQKVSFVIEPPSGNMFDAANVGKTLQHISTILTAPSASIPKGHKMLCSLAGIDMTPGGKITFDFILTLQATKRARPALSAAKGQKP